MKAVLYAATATSNPFTGDTIWGQRARLMAYAKEHDIEVIGIHSDQGFPGSMVDRPQFRAAMQTIKDGSADVILVASYGSLSEGMCGEVLQNLPVIALDEKNQRTEREAESHEL